MTKSLEQVIEKLRALPAEEQDAAASLIAQVIPTDAQALRDWQDAGIREALAALDRGEGISHSDIKNWAAALPTS